TVIAVSFFESVVRDHSKDHPMTVTASRSDTLTGAIHHSAGLHYNGTSARSTLSRRCRGNQHLGRRIWVTVEVKWQTPEQLPSGISDPPGVRRVRRGYGDRVATGLKGFGLFSAFAGLLLAGALGD
ncbi:MAG: hypothetical protein AB7G36_15550, partial [Candidatus Nanopelagicales bacterium]